MKRIIGLVLVVGLVASVAHTDTDFVEIGLPGNIDDIATGYGAVGYKYSIGKYEVTSGQFFASGLGGTSGVNTPVVNVNWHDAAQFCNWMTTGDTASGAYSIDGEGNVTDTDRASAIGLYGTVYVLPTLDEWYKAAYYDALSGAGYSTYADGSSTMPVAGTDVNYGAPLLSGSAWVVGSGYNEQNGTKDMMGNVWEWLESPDSNPSDRLVTGGSWYTDAQSLKNAGSRPGYASGTEGDRLGFRVAVVPEPGTLSLMGLSTIGLLSARTLRRRKLTGKSLLPIRRGKFCDTYCTLEEWEASFEEEKESIHFPDALGEATLSSFQLVWNKAYVRYKALDRVFWNHMVVFHESFSVAKKAFRKALKGNALACFDGFLALFMK